MFWKKNVQCLQCLTRTFFSQSESQIFDIVILVRTKILESDNFSATGLKTRPPGSRGSKPQFNRNTITSPTWFLENFVILNVKGAMWFVIQRGNTYLKIIPMQKIIITDRIKVKWAQLVHIWLIFVFFHDPAVIVQILHLFAIQNTIWIGDHLMIGHRFMSWIPDKSVI